VRSVIDLQFHETVIAPQTTRHPIVSGRSRGRNAPITSRSYPRQNDLQERGMFGTLIESQAQRQRRPGSSMASIIIHGAIISGALAATARETLPARPPEKLVHPIVYEKPADPPPPVARRVVSENVVPAGPVFRERLVISPVIPPDIPAIDLTAAPASPDFTARPIGVSGSGCQEGCARNPIGDGDRVLWTTSDIAIQLRDPVSPRYPEPLRRAGVEGNVVARFVVDTTGRIDMSAIEILSSDHALFSASVREALARMRFSPSMVGERKVKALAVMPFRFTLR
jgi:protein TonB